MGILTRKGGEDDELPGGGAGLVLDLDERVCATCRRDLPPWQATCPADGGAAVLRSSLRPLGLAEPPAFLLDDDEPTSSAEPEDD